MGVVSTFYFALLTDRAFSLTTAYEGLQPFEAAYLAPNINWTANPEHLTILPQSIPPNNENGPAPFEGSAFQVFNAINPESREDDGPGQLIEMFKSGNLTNLAHNKEVVFMITNRGTSVRLFDNPYHANQLKSMGLTPETAFQCAIDFLFYPRPEVMGLMEHEMQILQEPPVFSIGMHIRIGDHVLHGNDDTNVQAPTIANFFDCAQQVEDTFKPHLELNNLSVVWFLLSDSEKLRKHAKKIYGKKLITRLHRKIEHTFGHQYTNTKAQASLEGFLEAVAEQWLLGCTDAHVVDLHSGFGMVAAYRRFREDRIFFVDSMSPGMKPQCQKSDSVTIRKAGYTRSGVRRSLREKYG